MKDQNFFRLFSIITSILLFSLLIGNVIMAPIIIYYKLLVKFFGWLFLFLVLFLTGGKFYSNFLQLKNSPENSISPILLLKKTLGQTISQLVQRSAGFFVYLAFLIVIGSVTFFTIWFNSKLFNIEVN